MMINVVFDPLFHTWKGIESYSYMLFGIVLLQYCVQTD